MFLLDTPGVLAPRIESVEMGLKLALCGELEPPLSAPSCCRAWRLVPTFLGPAVADTSERAERAWQAACQPLLPVTWATALTPWTPTAWSAPAFSQLTAEAEWAGAAVLW